MSDDDAAPIAPVGDVKAVETGKPDTQQEHCHYHAGIEFVAPSSIRSLD